MEHKISVYQVFNQATFITHTVQMELLRKLIRNLLALLLYNPHGSDGTQKSSYTNMLNKCFITHTVQMERWNTYKRIYKSEDFITHTVQMEPGTDIYVSVDNYTL